MVRLRQSLRPLRVSAALSHQMPDIVLVADRPDLAVALGQLHWDEWGEFDGGTREEWISYVQGDVGRTSVPAAFLAIEADTVIGGVCLRVSDLPDQPDRTPWVCGMLVDEPFRGRG
jgi:hypothetical protein